MNKNGFALTETLVVVVFLVSIFTFVYVSIIPLISKYENTITSENDIDIVYKLYHVRRLIMSGEYKTDLTTEAVNQISCSDLYKASFEDNRSFCTKLMQQMELRDGVTDNYVLIYANSLTDDNIDSIRNINAEIANYALKYRNQIANRVLFLLDTKKHVVAYLNYDDISLCQRAKTLHTEVCVSTSTTNYCQRQHVLDETITYGNLGTEGNLPVKGDAFDCDVNGDGTYDPVTERFYYLSSYYNTNTKTFDSKTAVLVYYSDTINGVATLDEGGAYYSAADENWRGPTAALSNLPTITQWSNVKLKNTSRTIIACDDANCTNQLLTTSGGTIANPFSYTGKAARLLTLQELKNSGCATDLSVNDALAGCQFILERTRYSDNTRSVYGLRFENPTSGSAADSWYLSGYSLKTSTGASYPVSYTRFGIRPVIDIPMSRISY